MSKAVKARRLETIRPLLSSGTAAIRADAVLALAQTGDLGPVEAGLTDRTPIVRATARAALRRAGVDPARPATASLSR